MSDHKNDADNSRAAARTYDEAKHRFAESGNLKPAAGDAAKALDSDERTDLEQAQHAKPEDPAVSGSR